jgi:two-component system OmpR family sensor kinase
VRLAEDLLVLARADEGRLQIAHEDVDVRELLDGIAARQGRQAGPRAVVVAASPGLSVRGDPQRLRQAVGNLFDNAVRHGDGRIELRGEARNGAVRIVVRDHGPGFAPDFAGRAFERFSRPDGGRCGGSGLGLAIVDAIARAHGGSAAAVPVDDGAAVVIALPSSSAHSGPSR